MKRFSLRIGTAGFAVFLAATTLGFKDPDSCKVYFSEYANAKDWHSVGHRIRIRSKTACASRPGAPLLLEGVQVDISANSGNPIALDAASAEYFPSSEKLLVHGVFRPAPSSILHNPPFLLIDLRSGSIHAPGTLLELAESDAIKALPKN